VRDEARRVRVPDEADAERVTRSDPARESLTGVGLVLASCLGGGAVVVLARLAYEGGSNAPTSLLVRFALAGGLLWLLLAARGQATRLPARGSRTSTSACSPSPSKESRAWPRCWRRWMVAKTPGHVGYANPVGCRGEPPLAQSQPPTRLEGPANARALNQRRGRRRWAGSGPPQQPTGSVRPDGFAVRVVRQP